MILEYFCCKPCKRRVFKATIMIEERHAFENKLF